MLIPLPRPGRARHLAACVRFALAPGLRAVARSLAMASAFTAFAGGAAGAAGPMPAGLAETLESEGHDLTLQEWTAMTHGRTVWYRIDGALWGRESYRQDGKVTFQFPDGECLDADWTYEAPWYCFDFGQALGGSPHCFRHIRLDQRLYALGRSGAPQAIDRIDDAPIACGMDPSS